MQKHKVITNPTESPYPGGRGTDQLVVYTKDYGKPSTGTNEYGTEFVVKDGIVRDFGSNNYEIPENGFILSGHGVAQKWLQENLWYGSKVTLKENEIAVITDLETEKSGSKILASKMANENLVPKNTLIEMSRKEVEDLYLAALPSKKVEVRGIWHEQTETSPDEIKKTVQKLAEGGFNLLLLEVYYHGYTIYPSKLVGQMPEYHGWDPLSVWRDECEKYGIEIHPWVHCFFGGFGKKGSIVDLHPEWIAKRRDGKEKSNVEHGFYWLEPALDSVQDFLILLFKELFEKYQFSALHLDYIRYGETAGFLEGYSFSEKAVEIFRQKTGLNALEL
ncbi:MAG: family 10 glycosylhydrolase, partial [Bacillota bacterium]